MKFLLELIISETSSREGGCGGILVKRQMEESPAPGSMRPRRGTLVPGAGDLAVGLRVGFDGRVHPSLFYDQK